MTIISVALTGPATAQSAGSYTSGSSFNPVQSAINRNMMNAAILRQATGNRHHGGKKMAKSPARTNARK